MGHPQAGPEKDTFIVLHPGRGAAQEAAAPAAVQYDGAAGSGKGSAAGSGGGSPVQQQQPYVGTESQDPMLLLGAGGVVNQVPHGAAAAVLMHEDHQISQLMTGLSVGGSKGAAAAAGAAAKAGVGSVFAKSMHAGKAADAL